MQSNGCSCISYNRTCCKHPCSHCLSEHHMVQSVPRAILVVCGRSCPRLQDHQGLGQNPRHLSPKLCRPSAFMYKKTIADKKIQEVSADCLAIGNMFFKFLTLAQFITVDLLFQFFVHSSQKQFGSVFKVG